MGDRVGRNERTNLFFSIFCFNVFYQFLFEKRKKKLKKELKQKIEEKNYPQDIVSSRSTMVYFLNLSFDLIFYIVL